MVANVTIVGHLPSDEIIFSRIFVVDFEFHRVALGLFDDEFEHLFEVKAEVYV